MTETVHTVNKELTVFVDVFPMNSSEDDLIHNIWSLDNPPSVGGGMVRFKATIEIPVPLMGTETVLKKKFQAQEVE